MKNGMASIEGAFTGSIGASAILGVIFSVIGMAIGAFLVWNHAPMVGGSWWFYIRIGATIIGALVGAKIGAIVGFFTGAVVGGIVGGLLT